MASPVPPRKPKRGRALDLYMGNLVRDSTDAAKRKQFYQDLMIFFKRKWNSALKPPFISGLQLDLYDLYRVVVGFGGWQKVTSNGRWYDVLQALDVPWDIMAGDYAVKVIYMRYLYRFEQTQLFGEDDDGDRGDGGGSSTRGGRGRCYMTSLVSANECPYGRSKNQVIPDTVRKSLQLAKSAPQWNSYDRLIKSLESGLPNEVDFAINICTLLSHPGPRFLRLSNVPSIIELLLAHAGIFTDGPGSYRGLYEESWRRYTPERRFVDFWRAGIQDETVAQLLSAPDIQAHGSDSLRFLDQTDVFSGAEASYDQKDPVTARALQISSILRNLSFEAVNKPNLASSKALTKFLHVCINSSYTPLQSMALDTLSNIAPEISLDKDRDKEELSLLFRTLSKCLHSEDKFQIIRALETIAGLCAKEKNESLLCDFLDNETLQKILTLVIVKDIMMCVYTLECLYQVSELGSVTCQRISEQPKAIDVLMDLATVEAVSFGPSGLMGMKVVEYGLPAPSQNSAMISQSSSSNQGSGFLSTPRGPARVMPSATHYPPNPAPSPFRTPAHLGAVPVSKINSPKPEIPVRPPSVPLFPPSAPANSLPAPLVPNPPSNSNFRGPGGFSAQDQQSEQLALNWLKQNCTADPSGSVSRGELYHSYVAEMHRVVGSLAVSVNSFSALLSQAFPTIVIKKVDPSRPGLMQVEGLRFNPRPNPAGPLHKKPIGSGLPGSPAPSSGSSSPALNPHAQRILGAGPGSPSPLATQHPLVQSILARSSPAPEPFRAPAMAPSQPTNGPSNPATKISSARPNGRNSISSDSLRTSLGSQPESVETPESMSGTETPDSLISGVTDDPASPPSSSPKPGHLNSTLKTESQAKGSISSKLIPPTDKGQNLPKIPPNCHLEVCQKAQEAKNLIDTGDSHEAQILRVENTAAPVDEPMDTNEISENQIQTPSINPIDNGAIIQQSLPAVNGGVKNSGQHTEEEDEISEDEEDGEDSAMDDDDENDENKGSSFGQTIDQVVAVLKKNEPVRKNGVVTPKQNGKPGIRHTPSPDSMKLNVSQCQESINLLLSNDKEDSPEDENTTEEDAKVPLETAPTISAAEAIAAADAANASDVTPKRSHKKKPPDAIATRSHKKKLPAILLGAPAAAPSATDSEEVPDIDAVTKAVEIGVKRPATDDSEEVPEIKKIATEPPTPVTPQTAPVQVQMQRVAIPVPSNLKYMCEWNGCGKLFTKASAVYYHAATEHVSDLTTYCKWSNCDKTVRLRWSLITHLQDNHCSEIALKTASLRKYEISVIGHSNIPDSRPPPPHPGYSKNASFEAIRRHAFNYVSKELGEESEGPVTKSIRLTSCLILRNLARYSTEGRRQLRRHEGKLTSLSFSRLESSVALAQCLAELAASHAPAAPGLNI